MSHQQSLVQTTHHDHPDPYVVYSYRLVDCSTLFSPSSFAHLCSSVVTVNDLSQPVVLQLSRTIVINMIGLIKLLFGEKFF